MFFDRSVVWCLAGVLAWVGCAGVEKESDGAGLVGVTTELRDADGDGFQTDEDCNDRDASINPGAVELCDGIDNDCSGEVDEAVTDTFYVDEDGDGYGWRDGSIQACAAPEGFVLGDTDCDDTDAAVHPTAMETCNDVDDNCDGDVDEGLLGTWYADMDGDGYGDPAVQIDGCAPGEDYVDQAGDCDDGQASTHPDATEVCNERDDDCDGSVDEGVTVTYFADGDGDGYGRLDATTEACVEPPGYAVEGGDCDDGAEEVYPGASETCNDTDDNCDGVVDDSTASDALIWYADADADGYGDPASTTRACDLPTGFVADATDCDDTASTTNPAALEYCDGHDDDCDGDIDEDDAVDAPAWYLDTDTDGYGTSSVSARTCSAPSGYAALGSDCDDDNSDVHPGATEVCNDIDDDCDALIDDGDSAVSGTTTFYVDADSDGYGDPARTRQACLAPSGTVSDATDCDDGEAEVHPAATEVCNSVDDDCDGDIDDDDASITGRTTWYPDGDADGYGVDGSTTEACLEPSGYADNDADCDDSEGATYPSATEICDGEDNDCDLDVDEGVLGLSASCAAESCLEILDLGASLGDASYYLDPDGLGASLWSCDMTTDGGGWTQVVDWNRVDNADDQADFNNAFTVLFNNMDTFSNGSDHLFWQDDNGAGSANADALSVEREIPVLNGGEVLYTVEYDGVSMEQSGTWLWVEDTGTEYNLECWESKLSSAPYNSAELAEHPSYSCGNALSPRDFSWSGTVQDDLGTNLDTLRFASLHYDSCCDYSYLYQFDFWVR